jgi:hypothetical protein
MKNTLWLSVYQDAREAVKEVAEPHSIIFGDDILPGFIRDVVITLEGLNRNTAEKFTFYHETGPREYNVADVLHIDRLVAIRDFMDVIRKSYPDFYIERFENHLLYPDYDKTVGYFYGWITKIILFEEKGLNDFLGGETETAVHPKPGVISLVSLVSISFNDELVKLIAEYGDKIVTLTNSTSFRYQSGEYILSVHTDKLILAEFWLGYMQDGKESIRLKSVEGVESFIDVVNLSVLPLIEQYCEDNDILFYHQPVTHKIQDDAEWDIL